MLISKLASKIPFVHKLGPGKKKHFRLVEFRQKKMKGKLSPNEKRIEYKLVYFIGYQIILRMSYYYILDYYLMQLHSCTLY